MSDRTDAGRAVVREVAAGWQGAVLVCGKCSRRIGGGFGKDGRTTLARMLRAATGLGKGKRRRRDAAGVVEVKCLRLCPKRAVVVIDGSRPDRWLVVPAGTPAGEVTAKLPSLRLAEPEPDQAQQSRQA